MISRLRKRKPETPHQALMRLLGSPGAPATASETDRHLTLVAARMRANMLLDAAEAEVNALKNELMERSRETAA